jgi:hypothetical protein
VTRGIHRAAIAQRSAPLGGDADDGRMTAGRCRAECCGHPAPCRAARASRPHARLPASKVMFVSDLGTLRCRDRAISKSAHLPDGADSGQVGASRLSGHSGGCPGGRTHVALVLRLHLVTLARSYAATSGGARLPSEVGRRHPLLVPGGELPRRLGWLETLAGRAAVIGSRTSAPRSSNAVHPHTSSARGCSTESPPGRRENWQTGTPWLPGRFATRRPVPRT